MTGLMPTGSQPLASHGARRFRCDVSRQHDRAHILAIGELDLATVPTLEAEVAAYVTLGVGV
jgi:hypothetical protein